MEGMTRKFLWNLLKWIIIIVESFTNSILLPITKMNFLRDAYIKDIFDSFSYASALLLVPFVLFAILKASLQGEMQKHIKTILFGVLTSIMIITSTRTITLWGMTQASELSISLLGQNNIELLDKTVAKTFLGASSPEMPEEDIDAFLAVYKNKDFEINEKDGLVGGNYKWDFNMFVSILLGALVLAILFFIAVQAILRTITLAFIVLITPFASLSIPLGNKSGWDYAKKQILTILAMTVLQLFSLIFSLKFISLNSTTHPIVNFLISFVGMIFVMMVPNYISGIIGGQQGSILNSMQGLTSAFYGGQAIKGATMGIVGGVGQSLKGIFKGEGTGIMGASGNATGAVLRGIGGFGKNVFSKSATSPEKMKGATSAFQKGASMGAKTGEFLTKNNLKPSSTQTESKGSLRGGSTNQMTSSSGVGANYKEPLRGNVSSQSEPLRGNPSSQKNGFRENATNPKEPLQGNQSMNQNPLRGNQDGSSSGASTPSSSPKSSINDLSSDYGLRNNNNNASFEGTSQNENRNNVNNSNRDFNSSNTKSSSNSDYQLSGERWQEPKSRLRPTKRKKDS